MRLGILVLLAMLASAPLRAADLCPALRDAATSQDAATRIAAVACREHLLWYRAFIDRDGRFANSTVMEAENRRLEDGQTQAWRRVAGYWQESGLLRQMGGFAGARECAVAGSDGYSASACRTFIIDQPWSATFVSWVLMKAQLPGFRPSASHIDYVRQAYQRADSSPYEYLDPRRARPSPGDLLCYVRGPTPLGYDGLLRVVRGGNGGLNMHCEIVVAANPGNDDTAYLIGGNVQQGVTMRLLAINRNGELWNLPQRGDGDPLCSPDYAAGCNFNRKDWAVWLKLKPPEMLARLPGAVAPATTLPAAAPASKCCVNCVVGSGVPRCPKEAP